MTWRQFEPWYTVAEIAHILRVNYDTALDVVKRYMDYEEVNGHYKIYKNSFHYYLAVETICSEKYPNGEPEPKVRVHSMLARNQKTTTKAKEMQYSC